MKESKLEMKEEMKELKLGLRGEMKSLGKERNLWIRWIVGTIFGTVCYTEIISPIFLY